MISRISTDSRDIVPGDLFVALVGDTFDGHDYVDQALHKGACAVVVSRHFAALAELRPDVTYVAVDDTLRALGDMAHAWRVTDTPHRPLVAITGSNGKTTTKELCAAALAAMRAPVHKNAGNLNNAIGVPKTLFDWPQQAWCAVVEMGMNAPGEIARLAEMARPDVGLVTCVSRAHLGGKGLGSLQNIAAAKAELYAGLPHDGVCVLNADDAPLLQAAQGVLGSRPTLHFGVGDDVEVQLLRAEPVAGGISVRLRIDVDECAFVLPLLGEHNARNAAAAAAAAFVIGARPQAIAEGFTKVVVPGGRLQVRHAARLRLSVVDDTYNANPESMRAAFLAVAQAPVGGDKPARRVAVLGDMLELGPQAAELHREVGGDAARLGFAPIFACGEQASEVAAGAKAAGGEAHAFADLAALLERLQNTLRGGDVVLVKGSRGAHMERVVQALLAEGSA